MQLLQEKSKCVFGKCASQCFVIVTNTLQLIHKQKILLGLSLPRFQPKINRYCCFRRQTARWSDAHPCQEAKENQEEAAAP